MIQCVDNYRRVARIFRVCVCVGGGGVRIENEDTNL